MSAAVLMGPPTGGYIKPGLAGEMINPATGKRWQAKDITELDVLRAYWTMHQELDADRDRNDGTRTWREARDILRANFRAPEKVLAKAFERSYWPANVAGNRLTKVGKERLAHLETIARLDAEMARVKKEVLDLPAKAALVPAEDIPAFVNQYMDDLLKGLLQ